MASQRDKLDESILELLREDGRISNVKIGRRLDVSEATVRKRIARLLEADDVRIVAITGHATEKPLRMLFMVDTRPGGRAALTSWASGHTAVEQLIVTTGDHGFLIQARFAADAEALEFLDSLESSRWVQRVTTRGILAMHRAGDAQDLQLHATEMEETIRDTFATLHAGFGVDRVALHLLEGGAPVYAGSIGLATEYLLDSTHSVVQESDSPVLRAAKGGQPVIVDDVLSEPSMAHMREAVEREGLGSLVAVPLPGRDGAPIAVLTAYFDAPHGFGAEAADLQTAVVASVGPGLRDYLDGLSVPPSHAPK